MLKGANMAIWFIFTVFTLVKNPIRRDKTLNVILWRHKTNPIFPALIHWLNSGHDHYYPFQGFSYVKNDHNQIQTPVIADIYLFKLKNRNTRTRYEICSKLTMKTPEQCYGILLASLLLTLNIFHTLF